VLSATATTTAKTADAAVEMLRMFKLARASAVKSRTQAVNQLKAVVVTADPALRETLAGLTATALIRHCANLPTTPPTDVLTAATYTLRCLALRIQQLSAEARDLEQRITAVIKSHAPQMLDPIGVGPDSAAALLITAGDNPDRLHSDASFAALCGISPIEASSGKTQRRRLNRGGDRHANAALYRIAVTRLRCDPPHTHLHRPTHRPRQNPPRSNPLRQTLRRPRDLPATPSTHPRDRAHATGLTNIGASHPLQQSLTEGGLTPAGW